MKLMILGHGRHGKDTVADMLRERFGMSHVSSSWFAMERAVIPALAAKGLSYTSPQACFDDRMNHRADWYDAISAYNTPDPAKLGLELLREYDMYVGLRSMREFTALHAAGAFDLCWWVHRDTLGPEPVHSMTVNRNLADVCVSNEGSLAVLEQNVIWAWNKSLRLLSGGF